jgi:3'-phosphoadenosine 5'-phosphosulfate sulfotransferase (PAPS reductase)/FAD synthetase
MKPKQYLAFGGGVNSVALYLLMKQEGIKFEAIYSDHGCDWPITGSYVKYFSERYPLTILRPDVQGQSNLYDYCWDREMIPSRLSRWCTDKFKIRAMHKYMDKPAMVHLGIDAGESHRAKVSTQTGSENRFMLVEYDIDRQGCVDIIKKAGLFVPVKSGCWFCPFQRKAEWIKLRSEKPDLFRRSIELEHRCNHKRWLNGKKEIHLFCKRPLTRLDTARDLAKKENCFYCE